jgi:3-phenylpropionate/trans-cinnamate dioxygenase ferredoxin component
MSEFYEVARIPEIMEGAMKKVTAGTIQILLTRVKGEFYASQLLCPHLEADLSEGTLNGTVLTCPMHNSQYAIRDGHVVRWTNLTGIKLSYASKAHPPRSLRCYPVHIDGGRVLVSVP